MTWSKEQIKQYYKEYRQKNKERLNEYYKDYLKEPDNLQAIRDYSKNYYRTHKNAFKEYSKIYYKNNKKYFKDYYNKRKHPHLVQP
jgi:hypothetical protein